MRSRIVCGSACGAGVFTFGRVCIAVFPFILLLLDGIDFSEEFFVGHNLPLGPCRSFQVVTFDGLSKLSLWSLICAPLCPYAILVRFS